MTTPRDPEQLVRAFLDEGPIELSDRAIESVLGEIHRTRQRAAFGPWRTLPMTRTAITALAIVAMVSLTGLALWATKPSAPASNSPPATLLAPPAAPSQSVGAPTPSANRTAAGTIFYARRDASSGDDHLYAIAPDGTAGRQVETRTSCCLTVSPNGANLVYGLTSSAGPVTPAARFLPVGNSFSVFDSPAGLNLAPRAVSSRLDIAFEGWVSEDPSRTGIYLSLDNGGGVIWGTLSRLTTTRGVGRDVPLAFSADGSSLLFEHRASGPEFGDLYLVNPDGSGLRKLKAAADAVRADDLFGAGASWSPDGLHIAYSGFDHDGTGCDTTGVFIVDFADATAHEIAQPTGCTTSARWSPDGNWIAFDDETNGGGDHDVWLVHPDGSGLVNITASLSVGVCCGQWAPDSSALVIQGGDAANAEVNLWTVNVDGSGATQLTTERSLYKWYVWVPTP
jgi:hypothetical protein